MATIEQVVEAYYRGKDLIAGLNAQIKAIKEKQEKREAWLLQKLQEAGLQNMGVTLPEGKVTVYQKKTTSIEVADWDEALSFIIENEAWSLLHHKVSSKAAKELMDAGVSVPGIQTRTVVDVGITK